MLLYFYTILLYLIMLFYYYIVISIYDYITILLYYYINIFGYYILILYCYIILLFYDCMTIFLYYIIELYIITTTLPPSILQRKNIRGTSAACTSFQFCWNTVLPPFYDKPTPVRPGHFFPRITPDKWRNTCQ